MTIRDIRRTVSFWFREIRNSYYRFMGVKVGKKVFISSGAWIDTQEGEVIIEDFVRVTNGCKILSHDYSARFMGKPKPVVATTTIGESSFLGMNAIILPGVTIGKNCIIGSGCVVSKDVPDGSVIVSAKPRIVKTKNSHTGEWENADFDD